MSKDSKSLRICKYFFGRRHAAEAKKSPTAPPRGTRRSAAQAPGSKASPRSNPTGSGKGRAKRGRAARRGEGPREEEKNHTKRERVCKAGRTARSGMACAKREALCGTAPRRRDKTEERYPHPAGTAPLQCRDTRSPPREPDVRRGLPFVRRTSPDGGYLNASSPVRGRS